MDNHGYQENLHSYECLLAAGSWKNISEKAGTALPALRQFLQETSDWTFGHLGFGMKAETMQSGTQLPDPIGFADCCFFVPDTLLLVRENKVLISSYSMETELVYRQIMDTPIQPDTQIPSATLEAAMSAQDYIRRVEALKAHIHRGDCYEINFCQEFRAKNTVIDPVVVFNKLVSISPNPYSVFYKWENRFLMCASPERFFKMEGGKIWSQPIKGTAPRFKDPEKDARSAKELVASEKERSENVMVVDLVRNDLSMICKPGTVKVDELFGIYSFPQVHQMISTISGQLQDGVDLVDVLQATFPMGSMTGAPKKRVLELVEAYELVQRGIFSGAVGYCTSDGSADFNVVIRSLMYNQEDRYLSCQVGSGITWYADAAREYEECLLKVEAIRKALESTTK
ncbi:anthranilate synthase component I family protein [Flavihumibacter cheonanensis]|uniref:anthranilate synthase component I family protein n=1 Tax=Flavihumibacter cheonanensis TaxID=1442385 RepID=UPI001EF8924C|nr:anthranilate synthase component I family protein [Flavihumibacter cheonanensis]MCG7753617.1 anthranilate synthase component I family protein [Flavihumibacter cheonanensis]